MRIIWNHKRENGRAIYAARYGLIHFEYFIQENGNVPYTIYVRSSGKRIPLIKVTDNPAGPDQVDARSRCEFIGACLDNYLSFDLIPVEKTETAVVKLDKKPVPAPMREVCGLFINRTYLYNGERGRHYYRVYSIMNNSPKNDSRPILVGYRDIFSGDEWGCEVVRFTPGKYQLLPLNTVVPAPHDFKLSSVRAYSQAS